MVSLARKRLGADADLAVGDMRQMQDLPAGKAAAVLSYFALQHLDREEIVPTLRGWSRLLKPGGQLLVGAWEGEDRLDYGNQAPVDLQAFGYPADDLKAWVEEAGFQVDRSHQESFEGLPLDGLYLEATLPLSSQG